MAQIVCPSCNQNNEDNMAFCIYCGGSLKPGNASGRQPRIAQGACPSCGKSDVLNSQFCVHCGSVMTAAAKAAEAAAAAAPSVAAEAAASSSAQAGTPASRPRSRGRNSLASLILLAALLGLSVGAGCAYVAVEHMAPVTPEEQATRGLLAYTGKPYADFTLQSEDERVYMVGKADSDGTLRLPQIDSGRYVVEIDGAHYAKAIVIKPDQPEILGSPGLPLLKSDTL